MGLGTWRLASTSKYTRCTRYKTWLLFINQCPKNAHLRSAKNSGPSVSEAMFIKKIPHILREPICFFALISYAINTSP